MVARFLAGYHPTLGRMGIWLSRSGLDVTLASAESQFLLSTDYKNEQIFLSGRVTVIHGSQEIVAFPETLDAPPFVSWNESYPDGVNYYPFRIDLTTSAPQSYSVSCYSYADKVTFVNSTEFDLYVFYRVLCRRFG
ncbi:hypothetical protein [Afipia sp. P52-10]|uniref:hypothetical protein n=1 Tax=Afipia sp. P52-10 TaxID=1429916 RepID=UPI0012690780|nr:hypothetical protein [Afipia sp. P52-10]